MAKNPLRWSKKQKKIYDCLVGGMTPAQIVKAHKLAFSSIGDVKRAIEKGETPFSAQPNVPTAPKVKQHLTKENNVAAASPEMITPNSKIEKLEAQVEKLMAILNGEEEPEEAYVKRPDSQAVVMKLQCTPMVVEISPIMMATMNYFIQEEGFPADGNWTDLIDKIFYEYMLSKGIYITAWYDLSGPPPNIPAELARRES